ncbi:MAG TPA: hypothetical protein VI932_11910 [Bacteroidota bacterium]|nr:hypothetical protein [Bacteroidota bacterium]
MICPRLRKVIPLLAAMLWPVGASAQNVIPGTFDIGRASGASGPRIPSNSISHITIGDDRTIWIGTGKGLARTGAGGTDWESFRTDPAFASDGIFAIRSQGDTIWCSTGFEKEVDDGSVQTGSGYAYSTDNGLTWNHRNQVLDGRGDSIIVYGINDSLRLLPIVVPEQNVTFDVSIYNSTVWVASWASGLRKITDLEDTTWERILLPPDNRNTISPNDTLWSYAATDTLRLLRIFERFDPRRNNNFLAFSVLAVDDMTIWCGTAGGVNKSTDGGVSWSKYTHTNQASSILGNWVIAIRLQVFVQGPDTVSRIWTTNWQAEGRDEQFGVSYSDDDGRSWTNLLHDVRAYDFAFRDSIAYIATSRGIFRTSDGGRSLDQVSDIVDDDGRTKITSSSFFSAGLLDDTVYIGTADGLTRTIDNDTQPFGSSWRVYRAYHSVGATGNSYAYPNPFSPLTEPVRIHYAVTTGPAGGNADVRIEIFDFGMYRIRTLINRAPRPVNGEYDEIWDGRNDAGGTVANGVYFYRIDVGSEDPLFGKIVVMQ